MKGVRTISAGYDHCVAVTFDNDVIGWGNSKGFTY